MIPFALRISIAVISVGAGSASEFADARDGISCAISAAGAIEDVSTLSVTCLLCWVPQAVLSFTTLGVRRNSRATSAALLSGSGPFTTTRGLVVTREDVTVSQGTSSVTREGVSGNKDGTLRVAEEFAGTVGLAVVEGKTLTVGVANRCGTVPLAVTRASASVEVAGSLGGVCVAASILAGAAGEDTARLNRTFKLSRNSGAVRSAAEAVRVPHTLNISSTRSFGAVAIVALLLAGSTVPRAELANSVASISSEVLTAALCAHHGVGIPHAGRIGVAARRSGILEGALLLALAIDVVLTKVVGVAGVVGTRSQSLGLGGVVLTLAFADSETRVPVTEGTSNTSRGFESSSASFRADVLGSVEIAVGIGIASGSICSVEKRTSGAALVIGLVEDTQRRKSDTFGVAEEVAGRAADGLLIVPDTLVVGRARSH